MTSPSSRPDLENYTGPRHYCWRDSTLSSGDPFCMEFCLVYDGILLSSGNNSRRRPEKHDMRRHFHQQLERYWKTHRVLRNRLTYVTPEDSYLQGRRDDPDDGFFAEPNTSEAGTLAKRFTRYGFSFLPLVNSTYNLTCDLRLRFMQRQLPDDAIFNGGDLDNRVKTLLDALKMPNDPSEVAGYAPKDNETPFYCLLEDDKLISGFCVSMERLLTPIDAKDDNPNRVRLSIDVKIRTSEITYLNIDFLPPFI